jgi:hypothetical protein
VRIQCPENLRFPLEGSSAEGESGPKARLKSVVDGQQVNIPVLLIIDNEGRRRLNQPNVGYRFKLLRLR